MCLYPIEIVNPTKDFKLNDRIRLKVPCGHCWECSQVRQREFQTRIMKQMEWNNNNKYVNYFITLTFNFGHIPTIRINYLDEDKLIDSYQIENDNTFLHVFDKKGFQRFLTSLKRWLQRKYDIGGINKINYFAGTEKGGKKGRPHIHLFLGVPIVCPGEELYKWISDYWQGTLYIDPNDGKTYSDGLGFIYPPEYEGGFVDGVKQNPFYIKNIYSTSFYVSKYITKDYSFYEDNLAILSYLDEMNYYKKSDDFHENALYEQMHKKISNFLPFHLCSKGFGLCILDELKADTIEQTIKNVALGIEYMKKDGKKSYLSTPSYILRKLCFDIRYIDIDGKKYVRYDLNDYGRYYKLYMYDSRLRKVKQDCKNLFSYCRLNNIILADDYSVDDSFFELLAVYKLTYREMLCPMFYGSASWKFPFDLDNFINICDSSEEFFFDFNQKDFLLGIANQIGLKVEKKYIGYQINRKEVRNIETLTYNNIDLFKHFDKLLDTLEEVQRQKKYKDAQLKKEEYERIRYLKHSYYHV